MLYVATPASWPRTRYYIYQQTELPLHLLVVTPADLLLLWFGRQGGNVLSLLSFPNGMLIHLLSPPLICVLRIKSCAFIPIWTINAVFRLGHDNICCRSR